LTSAPPAGALATLAGKRVLAVDDNDANRRILAATLAQWGIECVPHASGASALAWLEQGGAVDAAVVDLMMPGMNGIQFATLARAHGDDAKLPMILLSSAGAEETRGPGARNFRRMLCKPLHQEALFEALHDVFGTTPAARSAPQRVVGPAGFDREMATAHPLRILVVEDNPVNQKLIAHLLTRLGYRPDTAGNGLECLETLRARPYDLVLMDCQMPEMDGYEATERVRRGEGGSIHMGVRIVALTAAAMVGDREKSLQAGMNGHLTKPVQPAELIAVLRASVPQSAPLG
jgi:CheY-like chemotaxis protein